MFNVNDSFDILLLFPIFMTIVVVVRVDGIVLVKIEFILKNPCVRR